MNIYQSASIVPGSEGPQEGSTTPKQEPEKRPESTDKEGECGHRPHSPLPNLTSKSPLITEELEDLGFPKSRRGRGYLTDDIERVCKAYESSELSTPNGEPLTPYWASRLLVKLDSLDSEDAPSHGAVNAIFDRWERSGKALFTKSPRAFVAFREK
jgi:hypothetical protein